MGPAISSSPCPMAEAICVPYFLSLVWFRMRFSSATCSPKWSYHPGKWISQTVYTSDLITRQDLLDLFDSKHIP